MDTNIERCVALSALGLLVGCSPSAPVNSPAAGAPAASQTLGASIYDGNCIACHQQDARGVPGVYPSLVGSPVVLGDPAAFSSWVVEGRRAASMTPGRYPTEMPKFGWMKDSDAAALLTYLRSLK